MLHGLTSALNRAVMERATLWLNHVLGGEPAALQRLRPHAGRSIRLSLQDWPALLASVAGAPAPAVWRVTPAGLLEWCDEAPQRPDLELAVDASNPALAVARALVGERPAVAISGDAAFAADLSWLVENLRWDIEDDLARVVGPVPARELARLGAGVAAALRTLVRTAGAPPPRTSGSARP
jgi:ubiquinone biosynthesis protein UbiJ